MLAHGKHTINNTILPLIQTCGVYLYNLYSMGKYRKASSLLKLYSDQSDIIYIYIYIYIYILYRYIYTYLRGVFWGKQYSALCINGKDINL